MKQSNVKIAVTGGIGSGKSTVCRIIENSGFPVYSCDAIYAELLNGKELPAKIAEEFGYGVLNSDGTLNRRKLSEIVFGNEELLKKLDGITHPAIFNETFKRSERINGIIFFEVPLLFEGGYQDLFDGVVVVLRDRDIRVESVMKRDGLSKLEIDSRINKQLNYDIENFAQYYVIHNDGNLNDLRDETVKILSEITQKYNG